ncbi:hypothetical protein [Syntrophobotulus glycolicus]|uniref:hypothetical protein n=1 Tax=Syntrophobotulus glycolicus TaxID=51197 RepID=UPI00145F87CA|nr:hypothetical protein [Syntrophobotulus glycolicus]
MAYTTGNMKHAGCQSALDFVKSKKTKDGYWKINYVYKSDGYVSFDQRGEKANWLTYLLDRCFTYSYFI